jgi:hypothetical protein
MSKVYVTWNPLQEKVVCVHTNSDDWCDKCKSATELLKDTPYFLQGDWFDVEVEK